MNFHFIKMTLAQWEKIHSGHKKVFVTKEPELKEDEFFGIVRLPGVRVIICRDCQEAYLMEVYEEKKTINAQGEETPI